MTPFFRKLTWLARRRQKEAELEEELQFHIDEDTDDRADDGVPKGEARRAARTQLGSLAIVREDTRAAWTWMLVEQLAQDVRYALRTLGRSPGFTIVAVLTLALGIGANTAMFSVVNAAILRPLGYPEPERLKSLATRSRAGRQGSLSPAEYFELTKINQSFSVIGAFTTGEANLFALDRPRRVVRATVNAELFEALAVPPERGRWFRREETRAGGPSVVMLSHGLWQSAFAAREDVVG